MKNASASPKNTPSIRILLVEDNPADVRLTREIFNECRIDNEVYVAKDGEEATAYLRKEGAFAAVQSPDLILLDLNLPGKSGREVLLDIKKDPALRRIPVVILTTSKAEEDILAAYDLHANCYIPKPLDLDHFVKVIQQIKDFWLKIVRLPPQQHGQ
jgi:two-component system, chemotaxis family, response regulator Rcp1